MKRVISGMFLAILITGAFGLAFNVQPVKALGTIYIRSDGNVDPSTAPILRDGDVYTLTSNITSDDDGIIIERDNMTLDGAGYPIQGTGAYESKGISLTERSNVTIRSTNIKSFSNGIKLTWSANNSILGNNIEGSDSSIGIDLGSSDHNTIAENNVTACGLYGLFIAYSDFNTVVENNIATGDYIGMRVHVSSNNVLRNNTMTNNEYGFSVDPYELVYDPYYPYNVVNDVDTSNTVDGKPVYYWVNKTDRTVPVDAGYVALIKCRNITVQDLDLKDNGDGVILVETTDSTVIKNNITNNDNGIYLAKSSNNNISLNNIEAVTGIDARGSSFNVICSNNITKKWSGSIAGIQLISSSNNSLSENKVAKNHYGVFIHYASNNSLYHNNFISNEHQAYSEVLGYSNSWDDGYPSGGNYWSDYNGTDYNHDGIGDTPYVADADNIDSHPLMGTFLSLNTLSGYIVNLSTNSSIADFEYFEANETIAIHVSNATTDQTSGFCRICIPHDIMNVSEISVIIDDGLAQILYPNYTLYDNGTHRWIYFAYEHSIHKIDIIPEFPTFTFLPLFIVATLLANMLYRRKRTLMSHNP